MFRYFIYRYSLLACLLFPNATIAGQSLYAVDLPIANRSHSVLEKTLAHALTTVFIRISGNKSIDTLPSIIPYLRHPKHLLHAYQYYNDETKQLNLHIQFSVTAVNRALQNARQGIWGGHRPRTVVSILLRTAAAEAQAINSPHLLAEPIQRTAQQRGLPIVLALMDLQDLNTLSTVKITEVPLPQPAINTLLARYQAEYALLGYISAQGEHCWTGRFIVYHKKQVMHWCIKAQTAEELLQKALDKLADQLAENYVILEDQALTNSLTLKIEGVIDYANYQQLSQALQNLPIIDNIQLTALTAHTISLQLRVFGDGSALQHSLRQQLGNHLILVKEASNSPSLTYQWHDRNDGHDEYNKQHQQAITPP